MNKEMLREIMNRIPIALVALAYLLNTAWNGWQFQQAEESPLIQMKHQVESKKDETAKLTEKVKQLTLFKATLDQKRAEVQNLAIELDGMKSSLSETVDVPGFMKTIVTEAKRVGLNVVGLKPASEVNKEYYVEHSFEFKFKGVYVQLMVFMDRLSQIQNIIRVDDFQIKPIASSLSKYVDLDGTVIIKTYHYQKSKADELPRKEGG